MGTTLWDYCVRTARELTCRSLEGTNTLDDWKRERESESGSSPSAPAILDDEVAGVVADTIPVSHVEGAHIVGILPVLDIPHAIGLVAPRPVAIPSFGAVRSLRADRAYQRLGRSDGFMWGSPLPHAVRRVLSPEMGQGRWMAPHPDRAADARRHIANMEELNWRCLSRHSLPIS